jgi:hypothetical protein
MFHFLAHLAAIPACRARATGSSTGCPHMYAFGPTITPRVAAMLL